VVFVNAKGDAVDERFDSAAEKLSRWNLNLGLRSAMGTGGVRLSRVFTQGRGAEYIRGMETDPNVALPAEVDHFYPMRRCIRESFEYQPVLMSVLVVALVVSVWLIGLRIRGCWPRAVPEGQKPAARVWAGLLEFALGRLVLAGMVAHTCLTMIHLAYESTQACVRRLPLEGLTSLDVYLFCAPLLVACVIYANCTVASLMGKKSGYFF
jgi:hypothetical protein